MNSYLINYQFSFGKRCDLFKKPNALENIGFKTGIYYGKTPSNAVKDLEKAGATIFSIILIGAK